MPAIKERLLIFKNDLDMEATLNERNGYINVVANTIGKLTLKIFDTDGRIASKICKDVKTGAHQLDLDINDWSKGTYILNAFIGDSFLKSFKLVKQ